MKSIKLVHVCSYSKFFEVIRSVFLIFCQATFRGRLLVYIIWWKLICISLSMKYIIGLCFRTKLAKIITWYKWTLDARIKVKVGFLSFNDTSKFQVPFLFCLLTKNCDMFDVPLPLFFRHVRSTSMLFAYLILYLVSIESD